MNTQSLDNFSPSISGVMQIPEDGKQRVWNCHWCGKPVKLSDGFQCAACRNKKKEQHWAFLLRVVGLTREEVYVMSRSLRVVR